MILFETQRAPNPRRVRMFLAEKGIDIADMEVRQVDLEAGENLTDEFKAMNPTGRVPVLQLDNGHYLSESVAICRYFEELYPQPPLFGQGAEGRAVVEMWNRRMELNLMHPIAMAFRHTTGHYADRENIFPEYGKDCAQTAEAMFDALNGMLAERTYVAGNDYAIADITALVAVDFARVIKLRVGDDRPHLAKWYARVSARPSAKA